MAFLSTRNITIAGTVFGALGIAGFTIPWSRWMAGPNPPEKSDHEYTIIAESTEGDAVPKARVELLGDGGPYSCDTGKNGVCKIAHVPSLRTMRVRVLIDDKNLYEETIQPSELTINVKLPASCCISTAPKGASPEGQHIPRHRPERAREMRQIEPVIGIPRAAPPHAVEVALATPLPPSPANPAPTAQAITPLPTEERPDKTPAVMDAPVITPPSIPARLTYSDLPRVATVGIFVEDAQIPDDAKLLFNGLREGCLAAPPFAVEENRSHASVILRCMLPGKLTICGPGTPSVTIGVYDQSGKILGGQPFNRNTIGGDYLLNVAEVKPKVCALLNKAARVVDSFPSGGGNQ